MAFNLGPWSAQILLNLEGLGIHQRKMEKAVEMNELVQEESVGMEEERAEDRTPRGSHLNANSVPLDNQKTIFLVLIEKVK